MNMKAEGDTKMKRLRCSGRSAITIAALCAASVTASLALAQPPGGPGGQGGPPPGGGQFGGPGRGPGGPMMGMRQVTVLDVPAAALKDPLTLTDDQTTKIAAIQKKANAQR